MIPTPLRHVLLVGAGVVSFYPAAEPTIFSIAEGNGVLADKLLQAAGVKLHLQTTVVNISRASGGNEQYTLGVIGKSGTSETGGAGGTAGHSTAPDVLLW